MNHDNLRGLIQESVISLRRAMSSTNPARPLTSKNELPRGKHVPANSRTARGSPHRRNRQVQHRGRSLRREKSTSDLVAESLLAALSSSSSDKENSGRAGSCRASSYSDDFRQNPDLWMAAFDNPVEFIQYCRKRLDHQRGLLERSRKVQTDVVLVINKWAANSEKHACTLDDLFKVQKMNDKLQEIIMEERTHCQHLIGENDRIEIQRQIMSRKFQAALILGKVDEKSVEHLLEKSPKAVPLADRLSNLGDQLKKCDSKAKGRAPCSDPIILSDKVERLESYIRDLEKQHRDEVAVLKDTINQHDLKCESIKAHYVSLLQTNAQALEDLRQMLTNAVNENLNLHKELLKKDDKFLQIQVDEISSALRKRVTGEPCTKHDIYQAFEEADAAENELKVRLARTEIELVEKSNSLHNTTSKLLLLDRKCFNLEEEMDVMRKTHQSCVAALKNRNDVLEKRCERLDERRKTDNAGFREDIQELKMMIKNLNRGVQRCIKKYGDPDLEKIGYAKPGDAALEQILLDAGFGKDRQSEVANSDFTKNWMNNADPVVAQKAMSIWSDYFGRKVDQLEERVNWSNVKLRGVTPSNVQLREVTPSNVQLQEVAPDTVKLLHEKNKYKEQAARGRYRDQRIAKSKVGDTR